LVSEEFEERLLGVDVLFTNSNVQRIVVGVAATLVAASSPYVDDYQLARCLTHAVVDGREGVDVEALLRDFVTYQVIRTYLKEHRQVESATDDRDESWENRVHSAIPGANGDSHGK
jgi:hypothetical protein